MNVLPRAEPPTCAGTLATQRESAARSIQPDIVPRPTLLVAEPEPPQALSTRKLILETSKFNVLTAHSTKEAIELFHLFPNISLAVLALDVNRVIDCSGIAKLIKETNRQIPVIALTPFIAERCEFADQTLSTFEPEELVQIVRTLVGDPRTFGDKA